MKEVAGSLTNELLALLLQGEIAGTPQEHSLASLAPRLTREDAYIDWRRPAVEVVNRIRAFDDPYDGAIATLGNRRVSCRRARLLEIGAVYAPPGTVLETNGAQAVVQAGDGVVQVSIIEDRPCLESV